MTKVFLIASMAALLAGCGQFCAEPSPIVKDTGCSWRKPIQVSENDTVETKRAALAAWKEYRANCPNQ